MVEEARLEDVGSELAPVTEGWFVVNAQDAAWLNNDYFGGVCIFESDDLVLCGRPDLNPVELAGASFTLRVAKPEQPASLYHAETNQREDFSSSWASASSSSRARSGTSAPGMWFAAQRAQRTHLASARATAHA